jgi:allophanate hydrolase
VPACASLDCVSIFALSVADGLCVRRLAEGYDAADPWSRRATPFALPHEGLRVGVLRREDREFLGSEENAVLYQQAIEHPGGTATEIEYAPFREVAALLYEGTWVAERQAAFAGFGVAAADLDPSVRAIFAGAERFSAADVFRGQHRLAALRRACEGELAKVDALLLPTAARSFTVTEMLAEPIARNAQLGVYTNFCNLLGLAAIAVPAGFAADGLPFGVSVIGPSFSDNGLAPLAHRLHAAACCGTGINRGAIQPPLEPDAPIDRLELAVVGAHLSGMPLNHELLALGGHLVARTRTANGYRLFVLSDTTPAKPGLVAMPGSGSGGIDVEVWSLAPEAFGRFIAAIPAPLGIGKITLADGSRASGFLCESWAVAGARDITELGGWRAYTGESAVL